MLQTTLGPLGFSSDEIKTYAELLKNGPQTAGSLAKSLQLARPSVYGFLARLHEKGLVHESLQGATKLFAAEAPEKIDQLFSQKIEQLEAAQQAYQQLAATLTQAGEGIRPPRFQLFEGVAGVQHVLKDLLLYRNLQTEALWPIKDMIEILTPDFFRYLNKNRIKRHLYTRAIWPADKVVDIAEHPYLGVGQEFQREIRVAPAGMDFSLGYWMYGNTVACVSSRRECFGFILDSREFTQMLRAQFELVWDQSTPLTVDPKITEEFLAELKK